MSHRLLVLLGNKLVKVASGDVELLELLADVCCTLSVDYTLVVLTGVFFSMICVVVPGVKGTVHCPVVGDRTTSYHVSSCSIASIILTIFAMLPSHASFSMK
jgi:hypothetical protein